MKDKISGMQDKYLEVTPSQMEDIIERTPLAQQEFRGLRDQWDTFTREELLKVRQEIKDLSQPKHHVKTPLPFPKE